MTTSCLFSLLVWAGSAAKRKPNDRKKAYVLFKGIFEKLVDATGSLELWIEDESSTSASSILFCF